MILKANAKVNLHLDIGPRRRDGFHSLKTIFQEISLFDTLQFSVSKGPIQLTIAPRGLPTNSKNLVVRALEMLREILGTEMGMKVHLTKKIPMGAGLGGGSSDAAAALWGGWMLWNKKSKKSKLIPPVLFSCAKKLGADVSFFLRGGLAKAKGIGEKLTPLKSRRRRWLVLIYPRMHVSTAMAYQLLDRSRKGDALRKPAGHFNSFEPIIMKKYPAIAKAKQALIDLGCADVMMSGSGSTVFGFVRNKKEGAKTLRSLKRRPWDSFLVNTCF